MPPPRASLLSIPYTSLGGNEWYLQAEFLPAKHCSQDLVVICHPHPMYGGQMYNNVVEALFRGLSDEYCTARFNFSGVGGSDGGFENGEGEIGQVKAVIEYLCQDFVQDQACGAWSRVHVAGYSFGAAMALPAALSMEKVTSCTAIALPFGMFSKQVADAVAMQSRRRIPLLFLTGDSDDFTPVPRFTKWVAKFGGAAQVVFAGADHFFSGYEQQLAKETRKFLMPSTKNGS
ncbi:MAG: hypothetical protein GYA24_09695 [Candidatus Lokiarchaeota archaeon]|nr:hypothetical protein [Candidatus Lokiarchaeota archaeon]